MARRLMLVAARIGTLLALLMVAGCQADLYSNVTESEANQMVAALMSSGIPANKVRVGETFSVRVGEMDMARAISVLEAKGYPKSVRQSIGSVFKESGIISSPFEERVRYIYALGEDVAQTLSEIDGVVTARVHVVLPDSPQLGQLVRPSSAAVFIKHEPTVDLEFFVPQIRRLVSSAIEGLEYAAVTVVLAESSPSEIALSPADEQMVSVLPGLSVRATDAAYFWKLVYVAAAVIVGLLGLITAGSILYLSRRRSKGSRDLARTGSASETALEPS